MLKRSGTEREMADAITAMMDEYHLPTQPRPASQPCPEYFAWRRAFHHNYGIFASAYAPTLTAQQLGDPSRISRCVLLMPISPGPHGSKILVPLRGAVVFGFVVEDGEPMKQQAERAAAFISLGIETQHMHTLANGDVMVAVPWDVEPVVIAYSRREISDAEASNVPSIWAAPQALQGLLSFEPAMFAVQRLAAMGRSVTSHDLNIGLPLALPTPPGVVP